MVIFKKFRVLLLVLLALLAVPFSSSFSKEEASLGSSFSGASTDEKISILAEEVERLRNQELFGGEIGTTNKGFGPAASKVYNTSKGLAIGGYGEIFNTAYLAGDKADKSDAYRGVFYIGYKFDDEWSLNTEIELEHVDESYLEFAYIDYDPKSFDSKLGFRAGLLLLPLGIINEIHEPTTYHGVFRPWVENKLIPTTSRENGAGIYGTLMDGKVDYKWYYVTSWQQPAAAKKGAGMRDFRGKGGSTVSNHFANVAKLEYHVNDSTDVGFSIFDGEINPSGAAKVNDSNASVRMLTAYIQGEYKTIEYTYLYHENRFSSVGRLNDQLTSNLHEKFGTKQVGYYWSLAKDIGAHLGTDWYVAPFFRYEYINFHDEVDASAFENSDYETQYYTSGLTIKPIYNIALKFDVTRYTDKADGGDHRQLNIGLGYIF
ncbi:MAG: hypothetical protein ACJ0N6_05130 [Thermodesulfobacteriota bacterium]|nr:MAG: hypothetical protein EVA30_05075 [Candidatus Dadabacteria bacterium]|tara:strand:+ start:913 stop:2205 length:1293 start_codon:yes stop_codon:yes gene_type:complete